MNLREARFEDHWRHVFRRQYTTRIIRFEHKGLTCLADGEVTIPSGIAALVGSNGVGKSSLMKAMVQLLGGLREDNETRRKLLGSLLTGTTISNGTQQHLAVLDGVDGTRVSGGETFSGEFRWLDPSESALRLSHLIHEDQNFSDLLEPLTPQVLESEELEVASYLVGKRYETIEMFEVADLEDVGRFPYFRVRSAGVTYGSEAMGRGELSLLIVFWTIRDLPKNSLLLLEEPETHVSPSSQDNLMNILAKACDEKGLSVIVTTHSPTIIKKLPQANLILMTRTNGPSAVGPAGSKIAVTTLLGGGVAFRGLLLVEDAGARDFLLVVLEKLDQELLRQFEVAIAGSVSTIEVLLKNLPPVGRWFSMVGLFDGDVRSTTQLKEARWPWVFLPGEVSPEELLQNHLGALADAAEHLANIMHSPEALISLALNSAIGKDHHDYFSTAAQNLGCDVSFIRRSAVHVWLGDEQNRATASELVKSIRKAIDSNVPQG